MTTAAKKISARFNDTTAVWLPQLISISALLILELIIAQQIAQAQALYLAFFFLLTAFLVFAFLSFENALMFLFIYIAFDGFIKNLTSYDPSFHIAKDIFLIILFVAYLIPRLLRREPLFPKTPVNLPILVFIVICFLQFLNPATHFVIGLGGIKAHVLPIVLLPIAFSVFETKEQVRQFITVLIILGTVVAAYSLIQYTQGPENIAKLGPGFANVVYDRAALWKSTATKRINFRPFSTTQDCGAASMYYLLTIPLAMALFMTERSSQKRKILLIGSMALLFVALVLSGVRTAWLAISLGLLLFGILSKRVRPFSLVLFFGGVATYLAAFLSNGGIMERVRMTANPLQAFMETRGMNVTSYLVYAIQAYPFGKGLGRAGPGAGVFAKWFPQEAGSLVGSDNYFLVMIYETGIIGALAILWVNLAILRSGYGIFKKLNDPDLQWISIGVMSTLSATLLTWLGGPTMISNPAAFYFWFLSGMLLKLLKIEGSSEFGSV